MVIIRIVVAAGTLVALTAVAPWPAVPQSPLVAHEERSCIDVQAIADTPVRDDRTVDFVLQGRDRPTYRNVLQDACPLLDIERTFTFSAVGNRLCRGNPIQVLQNGRVVPGPTCLLGRFRRVDPAK